MHQQLRLEPYAVHTTFQYAGTEGKRHRLREAMLFYDPPEYYDAPGKAIPLIGMLCFVSCQLVSMCSLFSQGAVACSAVF